MILLLTKIRLMQTNTNSLKYFQLTSVPCTRKNRKTKIIIHLQTLRVRQQVKKNGRLLTITMSLDGKHRRRHWEQKI